MALPFFSRQAKVPDQVVAFDLGSHSTKAVHIQRKAGGFTFSGFAIAEVPRGEKEMTADALAEHLRSVGQSLGARARSAVFGLGVSDSIVRLADLPMAPLPQLRLMLKANSKNLLQQELPNHVFDCSLMLPKAGATAEAMKPGQKCRTLVTAARRDLVDRVTTAAKSAGLAPVAIVPGLVCAVNALEMALPEVFSKEVVALVDLGFRSCTISLLMNGEFIMSRVVGIGGDKLTSGLSEAMGISGAEAEGIKVGMPTEVQPHLEPMLSALGRELRASIDFFEHQNDKSVSQVLVSGAAAASEYFVQALQNDLMVACRSWNPAASFHLALPPEQLGRLEPLVPNLTVALGAAVSVY